MSTVRFTLRILGAKTRQFCEKYGVATAWTGCRNRVPDGRITRIVPSITMSMMIEATIAVVLCSLVIMAVAFLVFRGRSLFLIIPLQTLPQGVKHGGAKLSRGRNWRPRLSSFNTYVLVVFVRSFHSEIYKQYYHTITSYFIT